MRSSNRPTAATGYNQRMIRQLPVSPLSCTVCGSPLSQAGRALRCSNGHSFDIAKEGYVNLMLGHRKGPKFPGDEKEMLQARRRFLDRGWYRPLSDEISKLVCDHLQQIDQQAAEMAVVDLGCGEGHYLGRLKSSLRARPNTRDNLVFGLDIAKEAIRLASKRHEDIRFIVSDTNRRLPFADGSAVCLLNIFSPRNAAEFARVIHPSGMLLVVIPNETHLGELRDFCPLLQIEQNKADQVRSSLSERFSAAQSQSLSVPLLLDTQSVLDLVRMTPNYWHMSPADWARLESIPELKITADFQIIHFSPT